VASVISKVLKGRRVNSSEQSGRGAALRLTGVGRDFGSHSVLRWIDLKIAAGEFVAIVGRSGCGKSTLLRLLAGLDRPTRGRIALGTGNAAGSARIMFQEPRLLPWARVVENVEVGVPESEAPSSRRERARELLGEVALADRADDWPGVLSGGQRQRVALARALASRPKLLLLDEPLGALDALTRIEMQRLLERIWLNQGFSAILVTHDVSEALTLADRVVLIDHGTITLDLRVDLPRPRRKDRPEIGALEQRILERLFDGADAGTLAQVV
jgi:sulfonate transport system ATP-binding protein